MAPASTWLEDDAEGRKLHRRVTESSRVWDEEGATRPTSTGAPDSQRRGSGPTPSEGTERPRTEFLRASRTASEGEAVRARRTNRRLRGLLVGVAVLLVASLVIGDLASPNGTERPAR
jgi:hypothetical protein